MRYLVLLYCFYFMTSGSSSGQRTYSCIDTTGRTLFTLKAVQVYAFSNGIARFEANVMSGMKAIKRTGYVDNTGHIIIQPVFTKGRDFVNGLAWVQHEGSITYTLINKAGKPVSAKPYTQVGSFTEGMCAVYENGCMGFIDSMGCEVIPCKYEGASVFSEGLVCLKLKNDTTAKYGFLDKKGNVAIPFRYIQSDPTAFSHGECSVMDNGKPALIDKTGKVTFTSKISVNIHPFTDGVSCVQSNKGTRQWGCINRKQKWLVEPVYEGTYYLGKGWLIACRDEKLGVIDTTGKILIPVEFKHAYGSPVVEGFFTVIDFDLHYHFYNASGAPFTSVPARYIHAASGAGWLPFTHENGKMGFLDRNGNLKLEARYSQTTSFSEGKAWIY